jgi:hypothetical protein
MRGGFRDIGVDSRTKRLDSGTEGLDSGTEGLDLGTEGWIHGQREVLSGGCGFKVAMKAGLGISTSVTRKHTVRVSLSENAVSVFTFTA